MKIAPQKHLLLLLLLLLLFCSQPLSPDALPLSLAGVGGYHILFYYCT